MTSRGWAGFTDDDIKNLQKENGSRGGKAGGCEVRPARFQTARVGNRERPGVKHTLRRCQAYAPVPQQARLSQLKEPASPSHPQSSSQQSSESAESSSTESQSPIPPSPCKSPTGSHAKNVKLRLKDNNSYEVIPTNDGREETEVEGEGSKRGEEEGETQKEGGEELTLDKLQERQKQIEEQNKRRRQLLVQAIADRSRQTESEAAKLKHIQSELGKLDSLLSADVSILRDQIEAASQEFNEAQKRYDRAEREFIEAKLQLFSRLERKELLTEHLCRIIEANERRKACKLSQLMARLELVDAGGGDQLDVADGTPQQILPQLASLDEVTYAACTTIKDPKKSSLALQKGLAKLNGDIPVEEIQKLVEGRLEDERRRAGKDTESEEAVKVGGSERNAEKGMAEGSVGGEGSGRLEYGKENEGAGSDKDSAEVATVRPGESAMREREGEEESGKCESEREEREKLKESASRERGRVELDEGRSEKVEGRERGRGEAGEGRVGVGAGGVDGRLNGKLVGDGRAESSETESGRDVPVVVGVAGSDGERERGEHR